MIIFYVWRAFLCLLFLLKVHFIYGEKWNRPKNTNLLYKTFCKQKKIIRIYFIDIYVSLLPLRSEATPPARGSRSGPRSAGKVYCWMYYYIDIVKRRHSNVYALLYALILKIRLRDTAEKFISSQTKEKVGEGEYY